MTEGEWRQDQLGGRSDRGRLLADYCLHSPPVTAFAVTAPSQRGPWGGRIIVGPLGWENKRITNYKLQIINWGGDVGTPLLRCPRADVVIRPYGRERIHPFRKKALG